MKREDSKPVGRPAPVEIKIDRQYLFPGVATHCFYIPVRDQSGKQVPEKDSRGNHKYSGDQPVYRMKLEKFEQVSAKLKLTEKYKTMCMYRLKADDPQYDDKLKSLESMRLDPSNMVMDLDMYERWRNPEAADAIIRMKETNQQMQEKDSIIEQMMAENRRLQEQLEKVAGK